MTADETALLTADETGQKDSALPDWKPLQILVVALCFALNMLDGADLLIMSFVAPVLSAEWTISPEKLGVLFSASLAGMAVGCLFVAPLSDVLGRRKLLLGALTIVCVSMIVSGFVPSVAHLMAARFLVGVGVGTIGVTMTAMATEFAPARHSSFAAGVVQAGWPLGSIITAFAAASLIQAAGWRPLFIGIGGASFVLLVVIFLLLPESLSYLLRRKPNSPDVDRIANRLGVKIDGSAGAANRSGKSVNILALFEGGRLKTSIFLWTAVAFGYFVLYFVISWIPKLVSDAGLPVDKAIYAGATYNFGAFLGTALMGWLAIRFRVKRVISTLFMLGAVALMVFGGVRMPVLPTLILAAMIGVTIQGGFNGFWALAAKVYPPEMRGAGIGWALGVGRVGAILGPIVGGVLVGAGASIVVIFSFYAVVALAAAAISFFISEPTIQEN